MGRGRLCAALAVALLAAVLAGSAGGAGAAQQRVTTLRATGPTSSTSPARSSSASAPNVDPVSRARLARRDRGRHDPEAASASLGAQARPRRGLRRRTRSPSSRSNPAVAYAEPNWIYHADAVPNDPRYSQTLRPAEDPGAAGLGRHDRQRRRHGRGRRHRHRQRPPRPGAQHRPGLRLRPGRPDTASTSTATGRTSPARSARAATTAIGVAGRQLERAPDAASACSTAAAAARTPTSPPASLYACTHGGRRSSTRASAAAGYSTRDARRDRLGRCANTLFVVAAGNDGDEQRLDAALPVQLRRARRTTCRT